MGDGDRESLDVHSGLICFPVISENVTGIDNAESLVLAVKSHVDRYRIASRPSGRESFFILDNMKVLTRRRMILSASVNPPMANNATATLSDKSDCKIPNVIDAGRVIGANLFRVWNDVLTPRIDGLLHGSISFHRFPR